MMSGSLAVPSAIATPTVAPVRTLRMGNEETFDFFAWDTTSINHIYKINPRNSAMFPWLAKIANNYDMYHLESLKFKYIPCVGSTTAGQVVMAIDYDPTDDNTNTAPTALQSYAGAITGQVYSPMECIWHENCTVMNNHKYFNSASETPDRLSDVGNLIVRLIPSPTTPANTVFGSLVASYVLVFHDPEINGDALPEAAILRNKSNGTAPQPATDASPLGTILNLAQDVQKKGFNETTLKTVTATIHDGVEMIQSVSNGFRTLSRANAMLYRSLVMAQDWTTMNPATGVRSVVDLATVVGDEMVFVGPEITDFLVVWSLMGTWTPTVADAPVLVLSLSGCSMYNGWSLQAPLNNASARLLIGGVTDYTFGYAFIHKMPGSDAVVSYSIQGAGVWSQVAPKSSVWSGIRFIPCPTIAY